MGKKSGLVIVFLLAALFFTFIGKEGKVYAEVIEVGENNAFKTITSALHAAENGDIIKVSPGIYKEKLEIQKSVTIESVGKHKAIIEGDHQKHVIIIKSPRVVIKDFTIRGSGHDFLNNDAGILIDQNNEIKIIGNKFEDILFGIYIDSSEGNIIKNNEVDGLKEKKFSERGNGIHFFNTKNNMIEGNIIQNVRDGMYFDHADKTTAVNNKITDVRYGLHYMWSNDNTFKNNYFSKNISGAAIMFSKVIKLENNIFEHNRGYRAFGIFFQTAEDSIVENNLFYDNSIGIYSDLSRGNIITKNTIVQNDIGMEVLGSNWDDKIYENSFIDNLQQVSVNEMKIRDQWYRGNKGNYWSDYSGIDMEKDGIIDTEYHSGSAFEFFMYQYPHFRLFVESPTAKMLQTVDKMFPVLDRAEINDPFPFTKDGNYQKYLQNMRTNSSLSVGVATFTVCFLLVALSILFIYKLTTRFNG